MCLHLPALPRLHTSAVQCCRKGTSSCQTVDTLQHTQQRCRQGNRRPATKPQSCSSCRAATVKLETRWLRGKWPCQSKAASIKHCCYEHWLRCCMASTNSSASC